MKYIKIPNDITLGLDDKGKAVIHSFQGWLSGSILNSKAFGADGKALRMSLAIEERFKGEYPGHYVPVEDDEYTVLLDSSENPEGGFNTPVAKLYIEFMDAVKNATDTKEEDVEEAN